MHVIRLPILPRTPIVVADLELGTILKMNEHRQSHNPHLYVRTTVILLYKK